ncbi:hypothetical protein DEU56DRAFT_795574 [Suillus clintonianus]|uniref:uncharacterized protein n=1 Tax=Suillus clintonianus TaxID=1904413 RepID=UPI001B87562E|nr:uncharacterized protein DEU56DRAFT_795574 [Suillus clintonianus]KAG2141930.1 hypothetical protein DEU56DRAFT_795574 [Suillus clintonianus]
MSRLGGIFTLGRPDVQGHYHPTQEELVLLTKMDVEHEKQQTMPSNSIYSSQRELSLLAANRPQILHTPEHALVHPGIDAIMFDADKLTVWLVQVMHGTSRPVSPEGLLFLLDVVRGSPYEPSPTHPWHFVYVTRGQPTKLFFHLSGQERTRRFLTQFWEERIKPYVMQLHDTDLDVRSSSNAYDQWGFPYKIPQRSSPSLPRRLANSLAHLVPRSRRTTESDITHDKMMSEIDAAIIRNSGVPGAQSLAEMVREQFSGPVRHHYVRDDKQTSSWRKRWAEVCR